MNSRHLSVSNIWWYVGMLFMLTIFRYHRARNKASHIAFSPYNWKLACGAARMFLRDSVRNQAQRHWWFCLRPHRRKWWGIRWQGWEEIGAESWPPGSPAAFWMQSWFSQSPLLSSPCWCPNNFPRRNTADIIAKSLCKCFMRKKILLWKFPVITGRARY